MRTLVTRNAAHVAAHPTYLRFKKNCPSVRMHYFSHGCCIGSGRAVQGCFAFLAMGDEMTGNDDRPLEFECLDLFQPISRQTLSHNSEWATRSRCSNGLLGTGEKNGPKLDRELRLFNGGAALKQSREMSWVAEHDEEGSPVLPCNLLPTIQSCQYGARYTWQLWFYLMERGTSILRLLRGLTALRGHPDQRGEPNTRIGDEPLKKQGRQ